METTGMMNRRTARNNSKEVSINGADRDMNNSMDYPTRKPLSPKKSFHSRTTFQPSTLSTAQIMKMHQSAPNLDFSDRSMEEFPITTKRSPSFGNSKSKKFRGLSPLAIGILSLLAGVVVVMGGYHLFVNYEEKHDAEIRLQIHREEIGPLTKELQSKVEAAEQEKEQLRTKLEQEEMEIGNLRHRATSVMPLKDQVKYLSDYKERMHQAIQQMSRQAMLEKFGPGPHRVQVQLAFDPDAGQEGTADSFVIEMASDEMPHSVYWFLQQVDRKLWDGTSFHRNAEHVVQAGPAPNFLSPPAETLQVQEQRFAESGFSSVLFQEYSAKHPHTKYTLGFAGRPGGPDFFINVMDNTRVHGPGGQVSYDDKSEADPCFARVVDGFDAVARLHKVPTFDDGLSHMRHLVAIKSMRILPKEEATR